MAALVWVMVGLALWHFTVFLPDHFWRDRRRVLRRGARLVHLRLIVNLGSIPGQSDTDLLTGVEAIPGALIGHGLIWWIGVRQLPPTRRATRARA